MVSSGLRFDLGTETWITISARTPFPLIPSGGFQLGNRLYSPGSTKDAWHNYDRTVFYFDPVLGTWQEEGQLDPDMCLERPPYANAVYFVDVLIIHSY